MVMWRLLGVAPYRYDNITAEFWEYLVRLFRISIERYRQTAFPYKC